MGDDNSQNPQDRSDETLSPKQAYNLTEEQGMMGKTVAKMFDVSPSRVSQLKSQYKEGIEKGKESVSPSDFEADELRSALGDEAPEENPYDGTACPICDEHISVAEYPDSAGIHDCPHCGNEIRWSEEELQ